MTRYFKLEGYDRLARVDSLGNASLLSNGGTWQSKPDLAKLVYGDPPLDWDEVNLAEAAQMAKAWGSDIMAD